MPVSGTSEKRLLCVHAFESLSFFPRTLSKVRVIIVAAMVNVMNTLKTQMDFGTSQSAVLQKLLYHRVEGNLQLKGQSSE